MAGFSAGKNASTLRPEIHAAQSASRTLAPMASLSSPRRATARRFTRQARRSSRPATARARRPEAGDTPEANGA